MFNRDFNQLYTYKHEG
uniref:ARPC4 n=1 Tax=Arundo donax TaxID=35708 RepID=A0A0A9HTL0_ARUDO